LEHNAENICRTIISAEEQNLNKQMLEFRLAILFQYSMNTSTKSNTFARSWKPISQFNVFNKTWEPCQKFWPKWQFFSVISKTFQSITEKRTQPLTIRKLKTAVF